MLGFLKLPRKEREKKNPWMHEKKKKKNPIDFPFNFLLIEMRKFSCTTKSKNTSLWFFLDIYISRTMGWEEKFCLEA